MAYIGFFQLILCYFSPIILYFFWMRTHTYIHEFTHIVVAWIFIKNPAIMLIRRKNKRVLFRGNFLIIATTPSLGCRGQTFIQNDFIDYTPSQIKKISIAPKYIQLVFSLLLFIIPVTTSYMFFIFSFPAVLGTSLLCFSLTIIITLSSSSGNWNDFEIYKNPEGFVEYMKNADKSETYLYQKEAY